MIKTIKRATIKAKHLQKAFLAFLFCQSLCFHVFCSGCEQEVMAARDAAVDCEGEEIIQKEEGLREKEGEERLTGRPGVRDR